jgi:hypothetical protein
MGSKSSAPPTPDYTGAAQATAAGNLQQAQLASQANHPNITTPYGSSTWTQPTPTTWAQNITLSPAQQSLLDSSNSASQQYANLAQQGLSAAGSTLANPGIDTGGLPQLQSSVQTPGLGQVAQQIMARQQPAIDQQRDQLNTQLRNQGLTPGTDAWNNAWRVQNQSENDLRLGADTTALGEQNQLFGQNLQSAGLNNAAINQGIQNQAAIKAQPLNILNALRTGSQVTNPQFGQTWTPQQAVPGANYSGAAQSTYGSNLNATNASNAANTNLMNGLFNLGGAAIGAFF